MDAATHKRMLDKMAPERVLRELGAAGYPGNDHPEFGITEIEVDLEDCLWLARNSDLPEPIASGIRRAADSPNHKERRFAALLFVDPILLDAGMKGVVRFVGSSAALDAQEFVSYVRAETQVLKDSGWASDAAETEVLWRMAESEASIRRPPNKWIEVDKAKQAKLVRAKNKLYMRLYRAS